MRTLVWFRGKDLRVSDHAPLHDAARRGEVIPVFVLDPSFFAPERARALPHRMQFLLDGLVSLERSIAARGSRLLVVPGKSVEVIPRLVARCRADRLVAHRWVEPFGRERDRRVARAVAVPFELYEGETLVPPEWVRTGNGTPYSVFTPFSRALRQSLDVSEPLPAPLRLPPLMHGGGETTVPVPSLESLGIARNPRIQKGGERAAHERLKAFLAGPAARYDSERDRMDLPGTSRLSADLKFGTLSVRTVWRAVNEALPPGEARTAYLNELVWREFTHSTLWDRPELLEQPFRDEWRGFPWQRDESSWSAWAQGQTGYPIVDAAARQLLAEGFVHNRARMVAASFLTKHLLQPYTRGEAHYLEYLTDGDWAQNNAGWQWATGCGCDAQPYFRIFNPVTQGKRFDPDGAYVRRWLPELAALPTRYVHAPWKARPKVLAAAGVQLGRDYPLPIVEHMAARARFLEHARRHFAMAGG